MATHTRVANAAAGIDAVYLQIVIRLTAALGPAVELMLSAAFVMVRVSHKSPVVRTALHLAWERNVRTLKIC